MIGLRSRTPLRRSAGSRARARRRLRRLVRRRRLLDALTGWLLALLAAASVFLAAVVWSGTLWSSRPIAGGASAAAGRYLATGDDLQILQTDQIAEPERLTFVYPGGTHDYAISDSTSTAYGVVWDAVVGALTGMTASQLNSATNVRQRDILMRLAQLNQQGPTTGCGAALEVDLGAALPWTDWLAALTNGSALPPWQADSTLDRMRVDRIVILPPPLNGGEASIVLFDGAAGMEIPLSAGAYHQLQLCQPQVQNPQSTNAYPVVPLSSEGPPTDIRAISQVVPVPEGLLVSAIGAHHYPAPSSLASTRWKPVGLEPEGLDQPDLIPLVVFPDPLAVQAIRSGSDVVYTAPQGKLVVDAPSRLALTTLEQSGPLSWYAGLLGALRYVSHVGGWPRGSWLAGSTESPSSCVPACASTRATYSFASRFQGLPVFGSTPAISVTMVGTNSQPEAYERNVTVAGSALPPQFPIPPAAALAALLRYPPPQLGAASFQVVSITPAWFPDPTLARLEPVWAVEVDTDTGGSPVVELVDAESGLDLGSWAVSG